MELEPSFLCEALGLQGRMDLLTRNADKLVELKSGKADEYPYRSPKDEHRLQMALYKEILYYNLDRRHEQVQSYLFYSRYPGLMPSTCRAAISAAPWPCGMPSCT